MVAKLPQTNTPKKKNKKNKSNAKQNANNTQGAGASGNGNFLRHANSVRNLISNKNQTALTNLLRPFIQGTKNARATFNKRLNNLEKIYTVAEEDSFEHKFYQGNEEQKLTGTVKDRLPDTRIEEVSFAGDLARPTSYALPPNPFKLDLAGSTIAKDGLIPVQTLIEIAEFISSKKYETDEYSYTFPEEISLENAKVVADHLQLLDKTFDCKIELTERVVKVRKSLPTDKREFLPWLYGDKEFIFIGLSCSYNEKLRRSQQRLLTNQYDWPDFTYQFFGTHGKKFNPENTQKYFNGEAANFQLVDEEMKPGKFRGVRMTLCVRDVENTADEVGKIMENLKTSGYINYCVPDSPIRGQKDAYKIGQFFATKKYRSAAELILTPSQRKEIALYEELKCLWYITKDASALKPHYQSCTLIDIERKILDFVAEDPTWKNFHENVKTIFIGNEKNMVIFYVKAFLERVWNEVVNLLIERRGKSLAVGDLVFTDKECELEVLSDQQLDPVLKFGVVTASNVSLKSKEFVRSLTQEDINSGKFSIFDMVLPICGSHVTWPDNDVGTYVDEVLKKYNISGRDAFKEEENLFENLSLIVSGSYRKVFNQPSDLKWHIQEYTDTNKSLILDDLPNDGTLAKKFKADSALETILPTPKKAVIIETFVPRTTFPVMILRELFKKNDFEKLFTRVGFNEQFAQKVLTPLKAVVANLREELKQAPAGQMMPPPIQSTGNPLFDRIRELEQQVAFLKSASGPGSSNSSTGNEPPKKKKKGGANNRMRGSVYHPQDTSNYNEIFDTRPGSFYNSVTGKNYSQMQFNSPGRNNFPRANQNRNQQGNMLPRNAGNFTNYRERSPLDAFSPGTLFRERDREQYFMEQFNTQYTDFDRVPMPRMGQRGRMNQDFISDTFPTNGSNNRNGGGFGNRRGNQKWF